MNNKIHTIYAVSAIIASVALGSILANGIVSFKALDRVVTVKGLSERDYLADKVIWPISYNHASNDLNELHEAMASQTLKVRAFLIQNGVDSGDISVSSPSVTDKLAQRYGDNKPRFRYQASQTLTVYSGEVEKVQSIMERMAGLLKQGVVFSEGDYSSYTQYLFTKLNEVKPEMVEEATVNARLVAEKFANDSGSRLGKIRRANQGRFSISSRDSQHPHIKRVRVVSTIDYNLID